ncbi:pyridoxamine 5'-phosphate oxidase family protein [Streptomyces sp. NPDC055709]
MVELCREDALDLLGSVRLGHVAFSHQALPAIRLVNHVVDDGDIVIRTQADSILLGSATDSEVVAYEADEIDPATCTGWSVVVTGRATLVSDEAELDRYRHALTPWVDTKMGHMVRIQAEIVTGYRLERTVGA